MVYRTATPHGVASSAATSLPIGVVHGFGGTVPVRPTSSHACALMCGPMWPRAARGMPTLVWGDDAAVRAFNVWDSDGQQVLPSGPRLLSLDPWFRPKPSGEAETLQRDRMRRGRTLRGRARRNLHSNRQARQHQCLRGQDETHRASQNLRLTPWSAQPCPLRGRARWDPYLGGRAGQGGYLVIFE
jgi:hypothetical protein